MDFLKTLQYGQTDHPGDGIREVIPELVHDDLFREAHTHRDVWLFMLHIDGKLLLDEPVMVLVVPNGVIVRMPMVNLKPACGEFGDPRKGDIELVETPDLKVVGIE